MGTEVYCSYTHISYFLPYCTGYVPGLFAKCVCVCVCVFIVKSCLFLGDQILSECKHCVFFFKPIIYCKGFHFLTCDYIISIIDDNKSNSFRIEERKNCCFGY